MQRVYPGARDKTAPRGLRGLWLSGQVYFALESKVWTGGMAFLDPASPGKAAGRGYLITTEQFADVVAQEMHREPGTVSVDVEALLGVGSLALGDGRYETLVLAGYSDGAPVVTFTAPERFSPVAAPSAAYLRMLAAGLREAHGWDLRVSAEYLAQLPGADLLTQDAILQALS